MASAEALVEPTGPVRAPGRRFSQVLLGRFTRVFAAVTVGLAVVLPGHGVGELPVCYFKGLFDLPCPGCGLTRSFASMAHLRVADAVGYHPFGVVLFPLMCLIVLVSLLPSRSRAGIASWLDARDARARRLYHFGIAAFLVYGFGRLAFVGLANGWPALSS